VLGVSDGIKAQVVSGVTEADRIKIPETAGPANAAGSGAGSAAAKPPARK